MVPGVAPTASRCACWPHAKASPDRGHTGLQRPLASPSPLIAPAALATAGKRTPREVDMGRLQEALRGAGVILAAPESEVEVGDPYF